MDVHNFEATAVRLSPPLPFSGMPQALKCSPRLLPGEQEPGDTGGCGLGANLSNYRYRSMQSMQLQRSVNQRNSKITL